MITAYYVIEALSDRDTLHPVFLYHGTSSVKLQAILDKGVIAPGYWGTYRVAEYYAEEATYADGGDQSIIGVPVSRFDSAGLAPDMNSLEEPLTYTLGTTEDDVWKQWEASEQTWQDSLALVESVQYTKPLVVTEADVQ